MPMILFVGQLGICKGVPKTGEIEIGWVSWVRDIRMREGWRPETPEVAKLPDKSNILFTHHTSYTHASSFYHNHILLFAVWDHVVIDYCKKEIMYLTILHSKQGLVDGGQKCQSSSAGKDTQNC